MNVDTYVAVRACAMVLLAGAVLQVAGVTAGRGGVVASGEAVLVDADVLEVADRFVAMVGADAALSTIRVEAASGASRVVARADR